MNYQKIATLLTQINPFVPVLDAIDEKLFSQPPEVLPESIRATLEMAMRGYKRNEPRHLKATIVQMLIDLNERTWAELGFRSDLTDLTEYRELLMVLVLEVLTEGLEECSTYFQSEKNFIETDSQYLV